MTTRVQVNETHALSSLVQENRAYRVLARLRRPVAGGVITLILAATPIAGQTLEQTLDTAYRTSPELEAQRARLLATDEGIALARTGYHPIIRADAIAGRRRIETKLEGQSGTITSSSGIGGGGASSLLDSSSSSGTTSPYGYQITGQQPIFDGFKTRGAIGKAEANVRAGRADLRSTEGRILLQAASAYLEAVRDQEHVGLRIKAVDSLKQEVASVTRRRGAQDSTNADVALTRARVAAAEGQLAAARASLEVSRTKLMELTGEKPGQLAVPRRLHAHLLPPSLEAALEAAREESPALAAAVGLEEAASFAVTEARSELLPKLSLEGSWSDARDPSEGISSSSEGIAYGRLSVPLYESGASYVRIRQAKHEHVARLEEIRRAQAAVMSEVTAAWRRREAAHSQLEAARRQERSAEEALTSLRRELAVNARSQVEVLDAEQELLSARIAIASARCDEEIASYSVLAAVGRLSIDALDGSRLADPPEARAANLPEASKAELAAGALPGPGELIPVEIAPVEAGNLEDIAPPIIAESLSDPSEPQAPKTTKAAANPARTVALRPSSEVHAVHPPVRLRGTDPGLRGMITP